MYFIYDEFGELMRKVGYKAEAIQITKIRDKWFYKLVRIKKPVFQFEDALF